MARTVGADPWRAAIERTLERSEVLVVLVSGASMASAEVRYELNRYRPLGRPVIPILLDAAGEAEAADLLARFHALRIPSRDADWPDAISRELLALVFGALEPARR
jgi:TIR domain